MSNVIHLNTAAFPKANEVSEETLGEYMLGVKEMTMEEMEALL